MPGVYSDISVESGEYKNLCEFCDEVANYRVMRKPGYPVYLYACAAHKGKIEEIGIQIRKYKIGSRL